MLIHPFTVCLSFILSFSSGQELLCPRGWVYANDKCWIFREDRHNWAESRLECLKMDSELASIMNDEDNNLLYRMINGPSRTVRLADITIANRHRLAQPVGGTGTGNAGGGCFDKHPMSLLVGFAEVVLNVPTSDQCLNECLNSQAAYGIDCKSVMYYTETHDCILNTQSRTTKPDLYTTDTSGIGVDYYDNLCGSRKSQSCYVTLDKMALFGFAEQVLPGLTIDQCKDACTSSQAKYNFLCNSGTYYPAEQSCILTREDRTTRPSLFGPEANAVYFEKSFNCGGNITGPCNNTNMDLMLIVDSSGSIGPQSFENIRQFLKSIVQTFNVNPNGINVGLVQFNENPRTEFHLKSYQTNEEVLGNPIDPPSHWNGSTKFTKDVYTPIRGHPNLHNPPNNGAAIDAMKWMSGYTLIGKALNYVVDNEFVPSQGDRSPIPNVAVVITDGMSQDNPTIPAQRLRNFGVITYAIGVTEAVSDDQLLNIAGSPDRVYKVSTFNKLDNRLRDQILKDICNPPKPQPPTPTTCVPSAYVSCMPSVGYPTPGYGGFPTYQPPSQPPSNYGNYNSYPANFVPVPGPNQGVVQPPGPGPTGPPNPNPPPQPTAPPPPPSLFQFGHNNAPRNPFSGGFGAPSVIPRPPGGRRKDYLEPVGPPRTTSIASEETSANVTHSPDRSRRESFKVQNTEGVWLGFSDQFFEGQFVWIDGQPINFTNWKFTEPNGGVNENCVALLMEPVSRTPYVKSN